MLQENLTLNQVFIYSYKKLSKYFDVSSSKIDSKILICKVKNISLEEFFLQQYSSFFSVSEREILDNFINLRIKGHPIAYIIQEKEFFSRKFYVNNHVLIPRPDTEVLVEAVLKDYLQDSALNILELGSGSGCIIVTLLKHFYNSKAVALDICEKALHVTKINAKTHGIDDRLQIIQSDWFDNIQDKKHKFDIIISNPPYICESQTNLMSYETKYEPKQALYASKKGTCNYVEIASKASTFLKSINSCIYVEIGIEQAESVQSIFKKYNFNIDSVYYDLQKIIRCVKLKKA